MSDFAAGVGVELDLASAVQKLTDAFNSWLAMEREYQRNGPVPVQLRGNVTAPASGSAFMDLGGPANGRLWIVRRLIVQGLTWGTTAAGYCNIHATSLNNQLALGGQDIVDNSTALPNKSFYSGWQVVLVNPQRLMVEIVGGTSAQIYGATGMAQDIPLIGVRLVASE
jgi:hypothetical protein